MNRYAVVSVEKEEYGSTSCAAEIVDEWDAGGCIGPVLKVVFVDRDLRRCTGTRILPESDVRIVGPSEAAAVCRAYWPRRS